MGTDKARLSYHGISQQEVLYNMALKICDKAFISLRSDQQQDLGSEMETILDRNEFAGPFNGILSAHASFPDAAWLVLACDLPLINLETLESLIDARDSNKDATALATRASGLPEPLAAIWEVSGLKKAIEYLQTAASSCPRKFLLQADTQLIFPEKDEFLANANSMEDYKRIKEVLNSK
ncbi:molybdenum cofactor guanylyltransferase [Muriicola soli]|uniref:Molybdenum cofactor guanylyltransferase n=2 Tax=Muriicola soli TaxID=2507538 RepID=A0A411EDA8_9FLAO|nr:molybdenum cofactor guanylyltransferase [Muriicola soli]